MQISHKLAIISLFVAALGCSSAPNIGYIKAKEIRQSDPSQSCLVGGHIEATMFWALKKVGLKAGDRTIADVPENGTVFFVANVPKGPVSLLAFSGIIPGNNYMPTQGYIVTEQKVWNEQKSPDTNIFHAISDIVHDSTNQWQPLSGYPMNDIKAECTGGFLWLGEYKFMMRNNTTSNYVLEKIAKPEERAQAVNALRESLADSRWITAIK